MHVYCWLLLLTLLSDSRAFVSQKKPKFLTPCSSEAIKKMPISRPARPLQQIHDAIGGSARVLVASAVAVSFVIRRDPPTYLWVAGGILNAALSKVLKRLINEARPDGAKIADPGMPSSHAMSLFYLAVSVSAAAQEWVPQQSAIMLWHNPKLEATCLIAYAIAASSWRVGAGLHTADQIIVGALLGGGTGLSWYYLSRRWLWSAAAPFFPNGKASFSAACTLLLIGAAAVGSVERRLKSWWQFHKQSRAKRSSDRND